MAERSTFFGKHTAEYEKYLRSSRWKKFRLEIMEYRAFRCQDCLVMGSKYTLQVHHLHYDTLGKEMPDDVLVLCYSCHKKADDERKEEAREELEDRLYEARLDGWVYKVYGGWALAPSYSVAAQEFEDWLDRKGYD
jgi:5-methylcytosine-specific restriction endonuclease McrA